MFQRLVWDVLDNPWIYSWYPLLFLVFVVWPIVAWLGRMRRRKDLRGLLGSAFSKDKSVVRRRLGLAVSEDTRKFAVSQPRINVLCEAKEILSIEYEPQGKNIGSILRIYTNNERLPSVVFGTILFDRKLRDIYARLNAMHSDLEAPKSEAADTVTSAEEITLRDAIIKLAGAVSSLSGAVSSLSSPAPERQIRHDREHEDSAA